MPTVIAVSQPMYSTECGSVVLKKLEKFSIAAALLCGSFTLFLLQVMYQGTCEYSKNIGSSPHMCFDVDVDKEIV